MDDPARGETHVLFVGGGTGGSVTPLLAVAEGLERHGVRPSFLGTARGPERQLVEAAGLPFSSVPAGKFRRYASLANLTDPFRTVAGFLAALGELRRDRPDAVVGAGSYVTVPVGWAARSLRIPLLVHQQDVTPGLANRLLARVASRITVALAASAERFPSRKVVVTGNPVRSAIFEGDPRRARSRFGLRTGRPVVLVIGGGTGALALNRVVGAAAPSLVQQAEVLHLTGRGKEVPVPPFEGYRTFEFLTDALPDALAVADVVVSRAGMATISELGALGKPVVLIPLPGTHQEANARFLAASGAARVVAQAALTPSRLQSEVHRLLADHERRARLGGRFRRLFRPDAAERVGTEVLRLTERR